jgi:hypothetical protein
VDHIFEKEPNMSADDNIELMRTLDDAWNSQDWDTFCKRHAENCAVYWPGQKEPTTGRDAHKAESIEFFKTFPDNHVKNRPYDILFGQGDWTCSVTRFTGTMRGPMKTPDGQEIPPTDRSFDIEFCTVARWHNGEITEERLIFDQLDMLTQLGIIGLESSVSKAA